MTKKKEQPEEPTEERRKNDPNRFTWVDGDIEIISWPKGKEPEKEEEEETE